MKLVSVVIPYYKKKEYFKETLESVIRQTYKNLEIIIVYDDDDKNDLEYIKQLASKNDRIKLIINEDSYNINDRALKPLSHSYLSSSTFENLNNKISIEINMSNPIVIKSYDLYSYDVSPNNTYAIPLNWKLKGSNSNYLLSKGKALS